MKPNNLPIIQQVINTTSVRRSWHLPEGYPPQKVANINTASKVSKYGFISGLNTGKYGPERTPHLDTFPVVKEGEFCSKLTGKTLERYNKPILYKCCHLFQ